MKYSLCTRLLAIEIIGDDFRRIKWENKRGEMVIRNSALLVSFDVVRLGDSSVIAKESRFIGTTKQSHRGHKYQEGDEIASLRSQ
jgi:hypothetical protein